MSASNTTLYQTSNSSASTLRPRNARLISFIEEGSPTHAANATAVSSSSSQTPPLVPSRGSSPDQIVGRPVALNQGRISGLGRQHARKTSEGGPAAATTDLWSSWSSIASSILGTEGQPSKGKAKGTYKQPRWMKQDKPYITSPVSPSWGPGIDEMPANVNKSLEDRQSQLESKKREALFMASGAENKDLSGKHKRRDSNAYDRDENTVEDALVYIHKIRREDTLPGVMLKYGCQPDVFRKVNRFWPNDNIQTRKHVFLPVEACSVRGKKVDEPYLLGLALEDSNRQNGTRLPSGALCDSYSGQTTTSPPAEVSCTTSNAEDHGLIHDSWVAILSFPDPIEILRMPRKSLGYFPRARRKSNATLTDTSTTSTPKTSFDMLRHPPTHAAQVSLSLGASPVRRPMLRPGSSLQRSSSTTSTQKTFADALQGPGGVGTLKGLRTEPSRPGPAEDVLNKKFHQYFPDITVAPPPEDPSRRFFSSARATPRASIDSVRSHRSNSSGLGDMPGAIEGFVRKLAGNMGGKGGPSKMGDLIELETNSDLGEPIPEDDEAQATPTGSSMNFPRLQAQSEEDLLNERFPIRGRVMNAYGMGVGMDKGD
jgi:hypothetical protein